MIGSVRADKADQRIGLEWEFVDFTKVFEEEVSRTVAVEVFI